MLYEFETDRIKRAQEVSFESIGVRERSDLQRLLRDSIDVIDSDLLVLQEEFGDWEESARRVDLLCLASDGTLVIVELKRTRDGGHSELQAIRYAAMAQSMTLEQGIDSLASYLRARERSGDAESIIRSHLGEPEFAEKIFASRIAIMLVAADFSKELTTSVLWLSEHGIDIRCMQLKPYRNEDGRLFVIARQIIPLPEAAEYRTGVAVKKLREQAEHRSKAAHFERNQRFWVAFLEKAESEFSWLRGATPSRALWQGRKPCPYAFDIQRDSFAVTWSIASGKRADWERLQKCRDAVESEFGEAVEWNLDRRRVAVAFAYPGALANEQEWGRVHSLMISSMRRFLQTTDGIGLDTTDSLASEDFV